MAEEPDRGRRRLFRPGVDEEVRSEMEFHLEMRAREYESGGMDAAAARTEARRRFGNVERVARECRTLARERNRRMRAMTWLGEAKRDLAFGVRQLGRTPAFSAVAVLVLGLGIGATTAIFGTVEAVLLRPLPFPEPERVVWLNELWRGGKSDFSAGNYTDLGVASRSYSSLAIAQYSSFHVHGDEVAERVVGARVSAGFFDVFGVRPSHGRAFTPEEDAPGGDGVVVLSHGLWRRQFGGDPSVVGREIRMNQRRYTVIGVMPASFDYQADAEELWVPIALTPEQEALHDEHAYQVYGRLAPGVALDDADAEAKRIMAELARLYPRYNLERSASVRPFADAIVGDVRPRLLILMGAVALVLLIACGNVANLLLVRGTARARELAVRASLGAGHGRLARQLLAESVVLGLLGSLLGIGLAHAGVRALVASAPPGVARLEQAAVNLPVLLFALALGLASALVFGLIPALRAARTDLQAMLRQGGRGMAEGGGRDRVRLLLIVLEVALTLVLLVASGLLIRSGIRLQSIDPGFEPAGLLTLRTALPEAAYGDPERITVTFERIVDEVRNSPSVRDAALVSALPFAGNTPSNGILPEGAPMSVEHTVNANLRIVTADYFRTMGVPVVAGAGFTGREGRGGTLVAIVSREFAARLWPGEDPIGKRFLCCEGSEEDPRFKTVIGVAGDVRFHTLAQTPFEFYLPLRQVPPQAWAWIQRAMTLVVRTEGDPAAIAPAVSRAVRSVDPELPVYAVSTMEDRIASSLAAARFNTRLLTTLGVLGLILSAVGIHGVIAYFVSQRRREIGVRIALGAGASGVIRLVVRQALLPVGLGIAVGAAAALGATRVLRAFLFEVEPSDPLTFTSVAALLALVAFVAAWLPARRATRVHPAEIIRAE